MQFRERHVKKINEKILTKLTTGQNYFTINFRNLGPLNESKKGKFYVINI